ncbi:MAG: hypothetical protein ACAH09_10775 [Methylophilaceae bacterium]
MEKFIYIPIRENDYLELTQFLNEKGDSRMPSTAICDAIDYWIDNADWKPELIRTESPTSRGYIWKYKEDSLFLPHDTDLRMRYMGKYHYAKVINDEIVYEGKPMSPALLVNTITAIEKKLGSRNAWKNLWIKRPYDKEWTLADDCRKSTKPIVKELGI